MAREKEKAKKHPLQHLIAGGCAGLVESSICHPLDTIKTRMQLRQQITTVEKVVVKIRHSLMEPAYRLQHSLHDPGMRPVAEPGVHCFPSAVNTKMAHVHPHTVQTSIGPIGTARRIVEREGFSALYKGLTAVWTGIIPKMSIRFVSFEQYREWLGSTAESLGLSSNMVTFCAGLASGLTEAILVVTPAEVCKIRMQSQFHSMMDPSQLQKRKYTNVLQTAAVIVREEGLPALYKGVVPTMLRQGCNQAVNFTGYNMLKKEVMALQGKDRLDHWQSLVIGGLSGGLGPMVNNPLDVVKTRLQRQVVSADKAPKYTGLSQACVVIAREEGLLALWKGITPRLMRIVPGQAITFMTYEAVSTQMSQLGLFGEG